MKTSVNTRRDNGYLKAVAGAIVMVLFMPLRAGAESSAMVSVSDAWVRETVPGQSIGAAYMRLRAGERMDLIGVKTAISKSAGLHRMSMQDGVMRMREVNAVGMESNKDTMLEPGGIHIMLMDLKRPLKVGETVTLTLSFRRADGSIRALNVPARVRSMSKEAVHAH